MAAESMTELALRLVEPESNAQERVMMVGHAVRREVLALNEGIERTLARAVELETLVQTEVNQLEQSYVQNQGRICQWSMAWGANARRWFYMPSVYAPPFPEPMKR